MKQKYIATIGALALTVPALAMAQTQQERSPAQTQQPGQTQQQQERSAQPGAQQQQRGEQYGQKDHQRAGLDQQKLRSAFKADNLSGKEITDQQGEEVGTIEDLLIDREGRVVAVLVSSGGVMGIGGETKAVEWDRLNVQVSQDNEIDRITTTMSEQEFDQLPEYDEDGQRGTTGRN